MKTYTDILKECCMNGYVEIEHGYSLYSQDEIIKEQKEDWHEEDDLKHFDFTKAKYWLQVIGGEVNFKPIYCLQDLIDIFEDYQETKRYFDIEEA